LNEVRPADHRDRIHSHHSPCDLARTTHSEPVYHPEGWGQIWTPITPKRAQNCAPPHDISHRAQIRPRDHRFTKPIEGNEGKGRGSTPAF
jgi:hypothetical protein